MAPICLLHWARTPASHRFSKRGPRAAASVLPGNKLGMQVLCSHPRPTESNAATCSLTSPLGESNAHFHVKVSSPPTPKTVRPPLPAFRQACPVGMEDEDSTPLHAPPPPVAYQTILLTKVCRGRAGRILKALSLQTNSRLL